MLNFLGGLIFIVLGLLSLILFFNKGKNNIWGQLYDFIWLDIMPSEPDSINY